MNMQIWCKQCGKEMKGHMRDFGIQVEPCLSCSIGPTTSETVICAPKRNRKAKNWKEFKTWVEDLDKRLLAITPKVILEKITELEKEDIAERVAEILKKIGPSRRGELATDVLDALDSGDTAKLEKWIK